VSAGSIIERPCIICGDNSYDEKFCFTYDFMMRVRGHDEAPLKKMGWTNETTSTIVKCRKCGCNFIRDVLRWADDFLEKRSKESADPEALRAHILKIRKADNFKRYASLDEQNWTVRNLVFLAATKMGRDIRFLDFGAGGGGETCDAARACGVREVTAYDPHFDFNIQDYYDAANFPGIKCISTASELREQEKFDAVFFQSAVEHVMDPRGELQLIFDNLTSGGYLYVNNPVMNLDGELPQLQAATQIQKRDRISYYHPRHLNYMMPRHFSRILQDVGFKILPMVTYAPARPGPDFLRRNLWVKSKASVRWLQNRFSLPYHRHVYFAQKP